MKLTTLTLLAVTCALFTACASAPTSTADQKKLEKTERIADRMARH